MMKIINNIIYLKCLKIPDVLLELNEINDFDFLKHITVDGEDLIILGNLIKQTLKQQGFVIIKNSNCINNQVSLNFFICICLVVGIPVEHNQGKKDFLWDIKVQNKEQNSVYFPTFSEHNLEASLHTDTQYHIHPESYISLLSIKQATCGGGKTILLDFNEVLKTLRETNDGRICLEILQNYSFPFAVPTVFAKNKLKPEIIYSPIISDNFTIRYRYDTIYKGLTITNIPKNDKKYWALNFFENHILNHSKKKVFHIEENHIIFIDNHRCLHGRTSFKDTDRHLVRVRLKGE